MRTRVVRELQPDEFWDLFPDLDLRRRWDQYCAGDDRRAVVVMVVEYNDGTYGIWRRSEDADQEFTFVPPDAQNPNGLFTTTGRYLNLNYEETRTHARPPDSQGHSCLQGVDQTKLREFLNEADGHTLLKAAAIRGLGFDEQFVRALIREFVSDPDDPKTLIFQEGGTTLEHGVGVHDLEFIEHLATTLGVIVDQEYLGRGKRARTMARAIIKYLDTGRRFYFVDEL